MPNAEDTIADQPNALHDAYRWRYSLRSLLIAFTFSALLAGWIVTTFQLRKAQSELSVLRLETGYLEPSDPGQIAAVRLPSDQALTYRVRFRVPVSPSYRVAYSTDWPKQRPSPDWYSAIDLPEGESLLTVQIQEDPRDGRWKITATVRSNRGTKRMATVLPSEHVRIFRESHDVMSTGIGRQTEFADATESIRLLDERWLVGESGLLLYGNREPKADIIGVFAELQPDTNPL